MFHRNLIRVVEKILLLPDMLFYIHRILYHKPSGILLDYDLLVIQLNPIFSIFKRFKFILHCSPPEFIIFGSTEMNLFNVFVTPGSSIFPG